MSVLPSASQLSADFKASTTSVQRSIELFHHIDAGFIHRRKTVQLLGPEGAAFYAERARPGDDHFVRLANDHLLVTLALDAAAARGLPTLAVALQQPTPGTIFCSSERIVGVPEFWEVGRPTNPIVVPFGYDRSVVINYGKEHIVSDTMRSELGNGEHILAMIGQIRDVSGNTVTISPIVMGSPWLEHPRNAKSGLAPGWLMWRGLYWFESFPEDVTQFQKMRDVQVSSAAEWQAVMKNLPEHHVKSAFSGLLGDAAHGDWGGEQYDHFAADVELGGRRVTAAFVFKGPAKFQPMVPAMLGKNGDQLVRLASSEAQFLVVQHCHEIGDAVRATLRALAVAPHRPRRYCFIDGRDTYRILRGYDLI